MNPFFDPSVQATLLNERASRDLRSRRDQLATRIKNLDDRIAEATLNQNTVLIMELSLVRKEVHADWEMLVNQIGTLMHPPVGTGTHV